MPEPIAPSPWPEPPRFGVAHTGYLAGDVDRLLDDLRHAADRGSPLAPLIEQRSLTKISFGYDTSEVDAFLDQFLAASASEPTVEEDPPVIHTRETDVGTTDSSSARTTSAHVLEEIENAYFSMAQRSARGYETVAVDTFLDELASLVQAGHTIQPAIETVQFPVATTRSGGYAADDVDTFLEWLSAIAEGRKPPTLPGVRPKSGGLMKPLNAILLIVAVLVILSLIF